VDDDAAGSICQDLPAAPAAEVPAAAPLPPLVARARASASSFFTPTSRGLHSSTSQLVVNTF